MSKHSTGHKRGARKSFICPICGTQFIRLLSQTSSKKVYCSLACANKRMLGKSPHNLGKIALIEKTCEGCQKSFQVRTWSAKQRFCSVSCPGKRGIKHGNYKGGCGWRQELYNSREYRDWRSAVLSRDGFRCRWCRSEGVKSNGRLEVHHILPVVQHGKGIFDVSNGITLCRGHHKQTLMREADFADFLSGLLGESLPIQPVSSHGGTWREPPSKTELNRLYWDGGMSATAIGKLYNRNDSTVFRWMAKYKIPRRNYKEAAALMGRERR